MFLNRLSSGSIGMTAAKLFVMDKPTILTVSIARAMFGDICKKNHRGCQSLHIASSQDYIKTALSLPLFPTVFLSMS